MPRFATLTIFLKMSEFQLMAYIKKFNDAIIPPQQP
jgi:hypothetical protein